MCTICKQNVRLFYFSAFCDIFIIGNFARKKDMLKPGCNGRFLLMFSRKIKAAALFFACVFLCSCGITRWDGFEKEDLSKYLILGEYRGLEFTEYDVSVSDSEVDEAINTALAALAGVNVPVFVKKKKIFDGVIAGICTIICFVTGVIILMFG